MNHTFSPDVLALNPELQGLVSGEKKGVAKYRNIPTNYDGHHFDSQKEARDYAGLKILETAGQITDLELQPRFVLQDAYFDNNGERVRAITYVADFMWRDLHTGKTHVKDSKGFKTKDFLIKEKMFRQRYPDYVFEVG